MDTEFLERHAGKIAGVLSCWDRVLVTGTLPSICHADAMTGQLHIRHIRVFDYARFVSPFRDAIHRTAQRLAQEHGLEVKVLRRWTADKEAIAQEALRQRGEHPGLVCILETMEGCVQFKPWHDKATGKTSLRTTSGRCAHYYFYFWLPDLGLCHVRVPTWAPFRLQVHFNGHSWLAGRLREAKIGFVQQDNAFVAIDDWAAAQQLANRVEPQALAARFDQLARQLCPFLAQMGWRYRWSLMQVEYATDIVFRRREDLAPLYETLSRTAVLAVKPADVATFLGRRLQPRYEGEVGNDFGTRIEGTRIKHYMGKVSLKMYDKFGLMLRIETTANDVSFFQDHRWVESRDGQGRFKVAPVKKTIYSLPVLRELLGAANRRYLEFLAALDDPSASIPAMKKLAQSVHDGPRSYRGFNLLRAEDLDLFRALVHGEFCISGFTARLLRHILSHKSPGQISRLLKRLRTHGLIKKIGKRYKYYLTQFGRRAAATALKLSSLFIIPTLAMPVDA